MEKGLIKYRANWKSQEIRKDAIRNFVEILGKDPRKITPDEVLRAAKELEKRKRERRFDPKNKKKRIV